MKAPSRHLVRRRLLGRSLKLVAAAALGLMLVVLALAVSRARLESPPPTTLLRDREGAFLGLAGAVDGEDMGYWPVEVLPARVVAATVTIEDRRFWRHPGVDARAVVRASLQNLRGGRRISGASTLAMQVARMQRPGPRTYPRKVVEATTALLLTARYGREEILRHYLRLVPYSNRMRGIAFAARSYFDKPVADLSWAETAFLAAIPQSPAAMSPFAPRGRVRAVKRGRRILDQLARSGVLTPAEHQLAWDQIARLPIPARDQRPTAAMHAVLHLEAEVSGSPPSRPIIDTTLDLALQREVSWLTSDALRGWHHRGAGNAAVLVVGRQGWEVLAAVSSADYFDARHAGAIDYLRVRRSAGSTLKPFFYGLALERGAITAATVLDDLQRGAGGIGNSDARFLGPLLPRLALANSRNVPAADLLARVGLDAGYAFLADLGLHAFEAPARHYGLGLAIGALPVSLEELLEAYTVLAGDGRLHALRWSREQSVAASRRLLSEETARQITLFLSDPQARLPTFPRMGFSEYPYPVAVKTGTSSDYRDAWTVAYSARYLVGVWVGHPDHRPMAGLSGYRSAASLARKVMEHLHGEESDGLENVGFPPPRGSERVRLCASSGRLATPACERVLVERLAPSSTPPGACEVHRHWAIDRRNGLLATAQTPQKHVETRAFTELPPRYAAWASAVGLPRPPRYVSPLDLGGFAMPLSRAASTPPWSREPPKRLEITSPRDGARLLFDPETPPELGTLPLRLAAGPTHEQVVWYVDGQPWRTASYPFEMRWPLAPGEHVFEARAPSTGARSGRVRVWVE